VRKSHYATGFFINSIDLPPGVGYDAAIGLASPFDLDSSQPFRTAITPDAGFSVFNAVERFDAVDPLVANGIYNFSLEVFGGDSDISFNSLAFLDYQIHIANGINVSISQIVATPDTISAGETTTVNLTVTNDDFTETFITTTCSSSALPCCCADAEPDTLRSGIANVSDSHEVGKS